MVIWTRDRTPLLRSLSSPVFGIDNPVFCHQKTHHIDPFIYFPLSGEAEFCQIEHRGTSSSGCQPPSCNPGLADPRAPESHTLKRSKSKVIHQYQLSSTFIEPSQDAADFRRNYLFSVYLHWHNLIYKTRVQLNVIFYSERTELCNRAETNKQQIDEFTASVTENTSVTDEVRRLLIVFVLIAAECRGSLHHLSRWHESRRHLRAGVQTQLPRRGEGILLNIVKWLHVPVWFWYAMLRRILFVVWLVGS